MGFELVHPFYLPLYNDAVAPELALPDLGNPHHLAILIGNTRSLWAPFTKAMRDDTALAAHSDPLDTYTQRAIFAALERAGLTYEVRFYWEEPPRRAAFSLMAHVSGLAWLSPTYLAIHPTFGPWIGLRAAVVIALDGLEEPNTAAASCHNCEAKCHPALQRVQAMSKAKGVSSQSIKVNPEPWISLRAACPIGREHRFSRAQTLFHYTHQFEGG